MICVQNQLSSYIVLQPVLNIFILKKIVHYSFIYYQKRRKHKKETEIRAECSVEVSQRTNRGLYIFLSQKARLCLSPHKILFFITDIQFCKMIVINYYMSLILLCFKKKKILTVFTNSKHISHVTHNNMINFSNNFFLYIHNINHVTHMKFIKSII